MQKKIIALAVAAMASGAAFAQSNVQVYGIVDMGYGYTSGSEAAVKLKNRTGLDSGQQNGSRIGFRGTEDLGNGLKASFVLEYGLQVDQNSTLGAGGGATARQQFLALSGNFGTVAFGRQYTPQFLLMGRVDPFALGTNGDAGSNARGLWAVTSRLDNLAAYISPSFGGFNVIAGYTIDGAGDEAATAKGAKSDNVKVWAINPNFKAGNLDIGFNYHRATVDAAGGGGLGYAGDAGFFAGAAADLKVTQYDLAGSYDFGVVKLSAAYGVDKAKDTTGDLAKTKKWFVGATVPVGAQTKLLGSYTNWKETEVLANGDLKASKWALGATYDLSKRTNLYAVYAKINTNSNLDAANAGLFSLSGTGAHEYTSGVNVGIRHQF